MDYLKIGNYIKSQRKKLNLTQQALADKLGISFQAVSKWEVGETLPDTALLLPLSNILQTTVDKLLNGGTIVVKRNQISISNIVEGFDAIITIKKAFGENNSFYQGMINGINSSMNIDIEKHLNNEYEKEVLYAEVIIQAIMNGSIVDIEEVKTFIKNEKMQNVILNYLNKTK